MAIPYVEITGPEEGKSPWAERKNKKKKTEQCVHWDHQDDLQAGPKRAPRSVVRIKFGR